MPDSSFDIAIVGAGPAGLAAARRAVESGARVALLDDNPSPGGQIWRSDPAQWRPLLGTLEPICGVRVVAAPAPGILTLERFDGDLEISYRKLVLATGARERFLPFPGWTLPNVMGAGGLQALVKSGLPIEGKRVIIAGSGPLLLAVAKYMRAHGAKVPLVAEQASDGALFRFAAGLVRHPGKLLQTVQFGTSLLGIRRPTSCWPIAADGNGKLESITLYRNGKTWKEPCDYLACGFGLIPNTEIPVLLGCELSDTGVRVNEYQETSVAGVYCAGEVTGIGGLDLSLVEGEIAGYAAAGKSDLAASLFGVRTRHQRFAASLEKAFTLREELKNLTQDETLVCRCEDVAYGRIRECSGWRDAKLHTRCGMGPCQGRVCGGAVEFLLGWKSTSVRPPVFPARIQSLTGPKYPQP
ncbi:MAG TPA: FAD/NAD(P)-binding oxidoreductase [Bryobacteraceae bacterium]|nr:FAD/NAD(P)-binding oxidoreductase [Bryobacteraceae bacterium]